MAFSEYAMPGTKLSQLGGVCISIIFISLLIAEKGVF